MTGKGVYTFSNGDRCVGTYVMGKKEGQGTMFYANGKLSFCFILSRLIIFIFFLFTGEKYVGKRKYLSLKPLAFSLHLTLLGMWSDGKLTGKGTYYYLNKNKYEGDFVDVKFFNKTSKIR